MLRLGVRRTILIASLSFIALPGLASAQLPSKDFTPGKAAKVSKDDICSGNYASSVKERPSESVLAYENYAIRPDSGRELVQLIPSSLGGTNDKENLFPLPNSREFGPAQKKALDDKLHGMVCSGTIELKAAQDALKKDWTEAYKKYMK
jgi:hypothetical protein